MAKNPMTVTEDKPQPNFMEESILLVMFGMSAGEVLRHVSCGVGQGKAQCSECTSAAALAVVWVTLLLPSWPCSTNGLCHLPWKQ